MRIVVRALFAALAGLALWAAFPPVGLWWCAIVGMALLGGVVLGRGGGGAFGYGWIAGTVFFALQWDFVGEAAGVPGVRLLLAAFEALFVAGFAWVFAGLGRSSRRPWTVGILGAAAWSGLELARSLWPLGGFPWGTVAFSQIRGPLLRLAPYGSTMLVSFVVALSGLTIAAALRPRVIRAGVGWLASILGVAVVVAICGFVPVYSARGPVLRVGIAQGLVPEDGGGADGYDQPLAVTYGLAKATEPILSERPDLILWPESASDYDIRTNDTARALVRQVSDRADVPILLGTQRYFPGRGVTLRYNQYVEWLPGGAIDDIYTKQHPVPFGEYVPRRDLVRRVTTAVDQISIDMVAGHDPAVMTTRAAGRDIRIATPICFEVAYHGIVDDAVARGAQVLVVPTNNASFGRTAESLQQFDMTRFRAVETGRYAIQVSTVGKSGVIAPNGVVTYRTKQWAEAASVEEVRLSSELTPAVRYTREIELVTLIAGGLASASGLLELVRHRRPGRGGRGAGNHRHSHV